VPFADLYIDKIVLSAYLESKCTKCGPSPCADLIEAIGSGTKRPQDIRFLSKSEAHALETVLRIPDLPNSQFFLLKSGLLFK
jgi:hypothetical protein